MSEHVYLNAIAAVLPYMLRQKAGQILNMDSVAGHQVSPSAGVHCSTKFFVQAMTESMHKELWVHHGIRVNTISPGVVNTSWADKVNDPAGRKAAQELNRIAIAPKDVARAVLFSLNQPYVCDDQRFDHLANKAGLIIWKACTIRRLSTRPILPWHQRP